MEVIEQVAGGVWKGRGLKGVIPGGSSTPVLTPEEAKTVTLDYESMAAHGTMFGSGGIVVLDETVDAVKLVDNLIDFYPFHKNLMPPIDLDEHSQLLLENYSRDARYLNNIGFIGEYADQIRPGITLEIP